MQPWKRTFSLIWVNNFITAMGMMAFLPLFPLYLRQVGVTDVREIAVWSGILVMGAPLTASFISPFWGALGDRIGRKLMLVRANLAITVFVGLMSLVPSPLAMLGLRLLQGVFSGFVAPALTLVSVAAPAERQGRISGQLHTAVLAGSICGPVLGGYIGDTIGIRWAFVFASALSAVAGALVVLLVKEEKAPEPAEQRARARAPWRQIIGESFRDAGAFLSSGPLRTVLLAVFAIRFGAALIDPNLALYIEELGETSEDFLGTTSGFIFSATAFATLLATPLWGSRSDRKGHLGTLSLCAAGAGLFFLPQAAAPNPAFLYAFRFGAGAFLAGVFPIAYAAASGSSSVERRGGAHGFTFASMGLANALGFGAGGVIAAFVGLRTLFVIAALLMLAAAVRVLVLSRATSLAVPTSGTSGPTASTCPPSSSAPRPGRSGSPHGPG